MKFVDAARAFEEREASYRNTLSKHHCLALTALRQAELCEQMIGFLDSGHFDKAWELAQKAKKLER